MRSLALAALMVVIAGPVLAQEAPMPTTSATALRAGLAGNWNGALGYRDYQSNALFEIPVTTTIEMVPDGVTQIRRSLFDDGPDKPVWITTVSLDDPVAGTVTSSTFRAGRAVELSTENVSITRHVDATHWTIVYGRTGQDGDGMADIRVTATRDGDALLEIKEVRPAGSSEAWAYRNQTRLSRAGD